MRWPDFEEKATESGGEKGVRHDLRHPDVHRPWSNWSEDETLHLVTMYSNPFRWRTRRELFNDFRRHINCTPNVKLYVVELAYGDRPFEVTDPDSPTDTQLRTTSEMWHKENCINKGVEKFPAGWKYGGYADADFTFNRFDWGLEAIHMLQHYDFVQLFSSYVDITGETATSWKGHRPWRVTSSFAWNYLHQDIFLENKTSQLDPGGDSYASLPSKDTFPFGYSPGATGGAWAWRRSAFNIVGGLLDVCILGSADWHMAFGLVQAINVAAEMKRCSEAYVKAVLQWQQRAVALNKNIGCVDNFAVHHWHGSKSQRAYGNRWEILKRWDFDPGVDISRDWQGVWQWTGTKPGLIQDVRRYFIERNEDDTNLRGSERELV